MGIDNNGLVLDIDYTKGNVKDYSGNGNNGVITNSEIFSRKDDKYGMKPLLSTGYVLVSDSSSLHLTEGTFVVYGDFSKEFLNSGSVTTERLFYKRSAGSTDFDIYVKDTLQLGFYDGTTVSAITLSDDSVYKKSRTIIITKSSGSSAPKLYIDGVFIGSFNSAVTLNSNGNDLVLGNTTTGGNNVQRVIYSQLIYDKEKSASEVAKIHKEVIKRCSGVSNVKGFVYDDGLSFISSGVAYHTRASQNKIIDVGSNGYDGTLVNVTQDKTVWGTNSLYFVGNGSYIDCTTATALDFTTETFGGYVWLKLDKYVTNCGIIHRGDYNVGGWYLQVSSSNKLQLALCQSGATQFVSSSNTIPLGVWVLAGFVSVAGGNNYLYINGRDDTSGTNARTNPASITQTLYFGRDNDGTNFMEGGIYRPVVREFSSLAEFEKEYLTEYERLGNKLLFNESFSGSVLSYGTFSGTSSSYEMLPYTSWRISEGDWKIASNTVNGVIKNVTQCTSSNGSLYSRYDSELVGTFSASVNKSQTANFLRVCFGTGNGKIGTDLTNNGYCIGIDSSDNYVVQKIVNGVATTVVSGAGYTAGDYVTLKLTRTSYGLMKLYADNVLVGSYTDTSYYSFNNIMLDFDANDKLSNIKHMRGIN